MHGEAVPLLASAIRGCHAEVMRKSCGSHADRDCPADSLSAPRTSTEGESRTHTRLPSQDFESSASAIPPLRLRDREYIGLGDDS